ncbi:MAG TPA: hypothetical protein VJ992_13145 [Gemmatimonadales bacterium]|nr:hypothetical protein [Gemmatimonadales bacterium]
MKPLSLITFALIVLAPPAAAQDSSAATGSHPAVRDTSPAAVQLRIAKKFDYRLLGPAAYSGRVTAVAVPAPYDHTMYVGSATGGLWKTDDDGITWKPVADKIGMLSIGDVAVAPSDPKVVWVGTGERNSLRSQSWGNGVHKSNDGGKTWASMGLADTKEIGRIVISPKDPNTVWVAALGHLWGPNPDRGVYKTTDGGKTWQKVLFVDDTTGFVDLAIDPANPDVLYAAAWHRIRWGGGHMEGVGAGSGIYKTTDGGKTWTLLTDPKLDNGLPGGHKLGRIGLAIYPKNPQIIYAVIQNNQGVTSQQYSPYGGIFRSDDGGKHWTQVNDMSAAPFYYYNEIWVDPNDADHLYLNASPLYESKDGGKTWTVVHFEHTHVDFHAFWLDPANSKHIVFGNDGGFYVSWDGGKHVRHAEIPIGQFYTVAIDSAHQPYRVCGGLQDNGTWCGPSATRDARGITDADWYPVNGGDGFFVQPDAHDPNIVYTEWQFGSMSRFNLATGERTGIKPLAADAGAESGYDFRWGWNTPILLSRFDSTVIYVGSNYLVKLTDRGDNWQVLGPDMTRAARTDPAPEVGNTSYHALFSIAESPRSKKILWTGSDDGLVWVTQDGGATWTDVSANVPDSAATKCFVSAIAASYFVDGRAYATFDCHRRDDYRPHVYRTEDFGRTWTPIMTGLDSTTGALTIVEDVRNPNLLWLGTETGVEITFDRGAHWHPFNNNLPPVGVRMMAVNGRARDLVVATFGRGMWINPIGPLEESTDSVAALPAYMFDVRPGRQFRESSRYPANGTAPFVADNPPRGAVFTYYLRDSADQDVKLVITDAKGDTVRTLSDRGYAGVHHVVWDLNRDKPRPRVLHGPTDRSELLAVPAGTYTVTTTLAGETFTRKFEVLGGWPDPAATAAADEAGQIE